MVLRKRRIIYFEVEFLQEIVGKCLTVTAVKADQKAFEILVQPQFNSIYPFVFYVI